MQGITSALYIKEQILRKLKKFGLAQALAESKSKIRTVGRGKPSPLQNLFYPTNEGSCEKESGGLMVNI